MVGWGWNPEATIDQDFNTPVENFVDNLELKILTYLTAGDSAVCTSAGADCGG
jgi:hypothetical protein